MNQAVKISETINFIPPGSQFNGTDQRAPLRRALSQWGQFGPDQTAGRFYPIACVALEIVQRCNLDCTLCYLSHAAEMAHDVPLAVLYSRIDMIHSHYGPGTFIQITGGDPTLRKVKDLQALCAYIKSRDMFSCLMTNGIKATDAMLGRLASAGLNDIAFHVDTTQQRKGYASEKSLNRIRLDYIARGKRAGLRVLFNTTIYDGNIQELPALAAFFRQNAHNIALISFQMQADTGRGTVCKGDAALTQKSVMAALETGMDVALDFGTFAVGHAECTRYASLLVAGNSAVAAFSNRALFHDIIAALQRREIRDGAYLNPATAARRVAIRHPLLALRTLGFALGRLWHLRHGLWSGRGKIRRMVVMIHSFMDADNLQQDRCESCVFMVATEDGPLSMCVHNARRDNFIFAPAKIQTPKGDQWWNAATGKITAEPDQREIGAMPFKRLKGRMRAAAQLAKSRPASR